MAPCERFRDLGWDFTYGLLEPEEAQTYCAHLEICASCREELGRIEVKKKLLAQAARVYQDVAPFHEPEDEPITVPLTAVSSPEPVLPRLSSSGRSRSRRPWLWASGAAAAVLVTVALHLIYHNGLASRQKQWTAAQTQVEEIHFRFAGLQKETAQETQKESTLLAARLSNQLIRLKVLGPTSYQAGGKNVFQIWTENLQGRPQSAQVTLRLQDATSGKVVCEETQKSEGHCTLACALPAQGERKELKLVVQARAGGEVARVEHLLPAQPPSYETHLALNKSIYQVGEILFFRTLTLDRHTLQPPDKEIPLVFTLRNDLLGFLNGLTGAMAPWPTQAITLTQGNVFGQIAGQAGKDGIGTSPTGRTEFSLPVNLPPGLYSLAVRAQDPVQTQVQPQYRNIEIVRDEESYLQFGGGPYRGGDYANIEINRRAGGPASKDITVKVEGKETKSVLKKDLDANRINLEVPLPKKFLSSSPRLEIQVGTGKNAENYSQALPVVPSKLKVDFFPEGGYLVAGLPNRVYYRVRTHAGAAANPDGRVIILSDQDVVDSDPEQGSGSFTFTPQKGGTLTARLTAPKSEQILLDSKGNGVFKKFLKETGVVLNVPRVVTPEGEALKVVLHNNSGPRQLLLVASCRGKILEQKLLQIGDGTTQESLTSLAGASGVVQITLFEVSERLVPLAERLVYRLPAARLDLHVAGNDKARSAEKFQLGVRVTNEKGLPTDCLILGAVVDEKLQALNPETGLPAFFFLAGDVQTGADLEHLNLLVKDTKEAHDALELFLGTVGWRRFVPIHDLNFNPDQPPLPFAGIGFFLKESASQAQLQAQLLTQIAHLKEEFQKKEIRDGFFLSQEKEGRLRAAERAALALVQWENMPRVVLGLALVGLALILLVSGCLFLAVGLIRLARRTPSPAFALSFCALAGFLVLFLLQGKLPAPDAKDPAAMARAGDRPWNLPVPREAQQFPAGQPASTVVAQTPRQPEKNAFGFHRHDPGYLAKQKGELLANLFPPSEDRAKDPRSRLNNSGQELRFDYNQLQQKQFLQNQFGAFPQFEKEKGGGKGSPPGIPGGEVFAREYVYNHPKRVADYQDTLLWHPALQTVNGAAQFSFDLSNRVTTYRILLQAHSPDGRLGFYEGKLEAQPAK